MSMLHVCDSCGEELGKSFSDTYYEMRFSIKRVFNAYDGFQPYKTKDPVELCEDCFIGVLNGIQKGE